METNQVLYQDQELRFKMKTKYKSEIEAMRDFYEELDLIPDYSCNTDGRIGGTLVEIKLNNSGGLPIKQLKRYIKSYNAVALPLPCYSLFININQREFTFIDNSNWKLIIDGKWKNPKDLLKFLNKKDYIKGWIDEFSIVAYNDLFYSKHLSAKKEDFIEEIKNPKELNLEPYYWNKTGDMERSILDCLGAIALKKRLGAFFTPDEYVEISTKYLRNAIARVPKGWDYIILDRCAGTGNLQKFLTAEELSHCVLNTYVYAEWTTLKGLYEDRVRCIIPHTKDNKDPDGLLSDGDALTEEFNKTITEIIETERKKADEKLIVIGLENPPYGEPQAEATRKNGKTWKQSSWVKKEMKKDENVKGKVSTDLANQFIWSMINYVNEYIVYAPIKYWKSQKLFDGKFNEGYLCNKKEFHATESSISLISWTIDKKENNCLKMKSDLGEREIKKIKLGIGKLLKASKRDKYDFVMTSYSGVPDFKNGFLATDIRGAGNAGGISYCKIDEDIDRLPLWVANCYKPKDYTEKEVIMKSGDGGIEYQKDKDFLDDCFVWSCLTNANKCISNKQIKNELCLMQNTKADDLLDINARNTKLLQKWQEILKLIKTTKEYNPKFNYGLHQICKEINIKIETGDSNKKNEPIMEYKYSDLNDLIKELKEQLKEFYNKYLTPKLFKYELLK